MALTLTPKELDRIKCSIEHIFTEVEEVFTRLNAVGSKDSMNRGNELLAYMYLLNELCFPDYQDDTYETLVSNEQIFAMFQRANEIKSTIKRNLL